MVRLRSGIALTLACGALAGCGHARHTSPPHAAAGDPQLMSALQRFSQCARSHGQPHFPDPILDPRTNRPNLPHDAPRLSDAAYAACRTVLSRVPPQALASQPPTAANMRGLVKFARCMRDHGVKDWPDPNYLGQFPLPPRLVSAGKPAFAGPMRACDALLPPAYQTIDIVQAR